MPKNILALNKMFSNLTVEERIEQLYEFFDEDEVLYTSSFGTSAVFLLFLVSKIRPSQQIHFIDTGYHFKETLEYKAELTSCFGLNINDLHPDSYLHTYSKENKLWEQDPDTCCHVNKVLPLDIVRGNYKVWVSGLMAFQSSSRKNLNVFEQQGDTIKFYPFIDVTEERLNACQQKYALPQHPLLAQGYASVGCTHCTLKGENRSGRWAGKAKVECGLHFPVPQNTPLETIVTV